MFLELSMLLTGPTIGVLDSIPTRDLAIGILIRIGEKMTGPLTITEFSHEKSGSSPHFSPRENRQDI